MARQSTLLVPLAAIFIGCGARGALSIEAPSDAGPPDLVDAAPTDTCVAGETFEVLRAPGPLTHPRLERIGDAAMLVITRGAPGATELAALPIDLRGRPRGDLRVIGPGNGGTIVGASLDTMGPPTFTLSFHSRGALAGARLDLDGDVVVSASLGIASDTERPLLVITPQLVANGWSMPGSPVGAGFVQDLRTLATTPITFEGNDPQGEVASVEHFHAVSRLGSRAIVETIDSRGGGPASHELDLADLVDTPFPVEVLLTRIADGPDDSLLVGGGTIRAIFDAIVHLQLGAASHTRFFANDLLLDADVAYDNSSSWLGGAAGILHGESGARPSPHVFFIGLDPLRRTTEIVLASGIPGGSVHPAILATRLPDASFLVVWEASADTLEGALVACGRR
jgi:hypothetical protein